MTIKEIKQKYGLNYHQVLYRIEIIGIEKYYKKVTDITGPPELWFTDEQVDKIVNYKRKSKYDGYVRSKHIASEFDISNIKVSEIAKEHKIFPSGSKMRFSPEQAEKLKKIIINLDSKKQKIIKTDPNENRTRGLYQRITLYEGALPWE